MSESVQTELSKKQHLEVNEIVDGSVTKLQVSFLQSFKKLEDSHEKEKEKSEKFQAQIFKIVSEIDKSVSLLNFKSGIWAAIGAAIPSVGIVLWIMMSKIIN